MADVFLSYSRGDQVTARTFAEQLVREGFTVWWDQALSAGEAFDRVTEKALDEAKAVVVLWSKKSVESHWVRAEATQAHNRNSLVPVMIEPCRRPMLFDLTHTADLTGWSGEAADPRWRSFIGGLRRFVDKSGPPSVADVPAAPRSKNGLNALWHTRRPLMVGVAAGLLLVAAFALLATRWHHAPAAPAAAPGGGTAAPGSAAAPVAAPPMRVEVLPFEELGSDAGLQRFSRGLVSEIIGELNRNFVPVTASSGGAAPGGTGPASAAQPTDIAFAFGGTVDRSGADILLRLRLDDVHQNTTVWSSEYRAAESQAKSLQEQIAMETAAVAGTALQANQRAHGDTELVNLLIQANLYSLRNRVDELEVNWQVRKRLADKLPDVSEMHSLLAIVTAFLAQQSAPERAAVLRSTANREIELAVKLNPDDMPSLAARSALVPAVGHWGEREAFLLAGLKRHPNPLLANWQSNLLREVGRLDDALDYGRMAQAPKPPSPNRNATLLRALAAKKRLSEALPLEEQDGRTWPTHSAMWVARLHTLVFAERWDAALGLFADGASRPIEIDDVTIGAWRAALQAMKSGNAAARISAAHGMLRIIDPRKGLVGLDETSGEGSAIAMLAVLGDRDAAFKQARLYLVRDSFANSSFLFWPNLGAFRADPRFMKLAADIGLVDYWRSAGKWPDFCAAPDRPYDCKAEAAKAAL